MKVAVPPVFHRSPRLPYRRRNVVHAKPRKNMVPNADGEAALEEEVGR